MNAAQLKSSITESLWQVIDRDSDVLSATLTGSFLNADSLDGLSDIDFVLVVSDLNESRYRRIIDECQAALEPILAEHDYALQINPTLGPLKFNEERLAVLHLMLYSPGAHVDHVINSPFTCLDWQQTGKFRKLSLEDCYPAFRLQPRHFMSARRSISEYLKDYRSRTVSYRELQCDDVGYVEVKRSKPMSERDRHEFAYHVIRFLMRNLLKLAFPEQTNSLSNVELLNEFHRWFPAAENENTSLFLSLAKMKASVDFSTPLENLDSRLELFLTFFERQFRDEFVDGAVQHIAFRHAPTLLHQGELRFIGRTDPPIDRNGLIPDASWGDYAAFAPTRFLCSPMLRCRESLELIFSIATQAETEVEASMMEMNYGDCEGMTIADARSRHAELFDAWSEGRDPKFPNGESTQCVLDRIEYFIEKQWSTDQSSSAVCTHNVVLRCLIGRTLGIRQSDWHRIRIPYLTPISFVRSKRFGLFVNLTPSLESDLFRDFPWKEEAVACKS